MDRNSLLSPPCFFFLSPFASNWKASCIKKFLKLHIYCVKISLLFVCPESPANRFNGQLQILTLKAKEEENNLHIFYRSLLYIIPLTAYPEIWHHNYVICYSVSLLATNHGNQDNSMKHSVMEKVKLPGLFQRRPQHAEHFVLIAEGLESTIAYIFLANLKYRGNMANTLKSKTSRRPAQQTARSWRWLTNQLFGIKI